ncbi:MAG: hypothetical protein CTY36_01335 [Methylocystis sp.]|nr:MAG: hypothetical protein CTY36_01335 [Methylocystis sp.]
MIKSKIHDRLPALLQIAQSRLSSVKQMQLSPLQAIVLVFLSAIASGTAAFALYATIGGLSADSGVSVPDWTPPTLDAIELGPAKPASADVQSLSRPIFSKNRRALPKSDAAPIEAATLSDAPTDLIVAAIVRHERKAKAFLVSASSPQGAWRKVGEVIDAWTVASIANAEVILQNGGQFTKVKLYKHSPLAPRQTPPNTKGSAD